MSFVMSDRLNTIKFYVNNMASVARDYGIRSITTLILVTNEVIIDQSIAGLTTLERIQLLAQHI
jgi:hypothetical protein